MCCISYCFCTVGQVEDGVIYNHGLVIDCRTLSSCGTLTVVFVVCYCISCTFGQVEDGVDLQIVVNSFVNLDCELNEQIAV